jgi:hypothetical protein
MIEIATFFSQEGFFYLQSELLCLYFYLNSRTGLRNGSVVEVEVMGVEAFVGLFNQEGEIKWLLRKKLRKKLPRKKLLRKKPRRSNF